MSKKYSKGGESYPINLQRAKQRYADLSPEAKKTANKRSVKLRRLRKLGIHYKTSSRRDKLRIYNYRRKAYGGQYLRCILCKRKTLLAGQEAAEKHLKSRKVHGIIPPFRSSRMSLEDYRDLIKRRINQYTKQAKQRMCKANLERVILEAQIKALYDKERKLRKEWAEYDYNEGLRRYQDKLLRKLNKGTTPSSR